MRRRLLILLALGLGLGPATGCRTTTETEGDRDEYGSPAAAPEVKSVPAAGPSAKAVLEPLGGSGVRGWATFTAIDGGVQVEAQVTGLTPGKHGFHIHEWGDCSAADGASAGSHFNPAGVAHAGPEAPDCHAGDMGNIVADEQGSAVLALHSTRMSIGEGPADVLGRGVIVHEKEDDLATQPTGAAGGRIACGVIMLEGGETVPVKAPPT